MYILIWEFVSKPESIQQFEVAYGPEGVWAIFFRKGSGYLGTELLKDNRRYLTIDRWRSAKDYEGFKRKHAEEYKKIDLDCELLTESETFLGAFTSL
jgi:heme-degrading monooxygenase HmoA